MAAIAVDICNTLADINKVLQEALGPTPNPSCYYHPGVSKDFFIKNLWVFKKAEAFPGSVQKVNELAKQHSIIYLTARPKEAKKVTKRWLKEKGYPAAPVIFSTNKAEAAKKLGIILAIDDAPHEIKSLKTVTSVLVHTQPYNQGMGKRFTWEDDILQLIESVIASQRAVLEPKTRLSLT